MRRILIGLGTGLGHYLASRSIFSEHFTYKQALLGLPRCHEAIVIAPSEKRLSRGGLGPDGQEVVTAICRSATRVTLLSSIDVYSSRGLPFDETALPEGSPTSLRRLRFERQVRNCGLPSTVIRLPDLFGPGMTGGLAGRLVGHDASLINSVAIHQWYPVRRLQNDLTIARELELPVVNLCPEPLPTTALLAELFPQQVGHVLTPAPYSRIRTRYAKEFGGARGYITGAAEILQLITRHVRSARRLEANDVDLVPAWRGTPSFAEALS